jgi:hypothetical protein
MAQQSTNNLTKVNQDLTTSYFNNFFGPTFNVSQDVNESILSFFEKMTANKESALAMARAVIYTAKAQNLDPMVILQKFAAMPMGQINAYLAMFLNLNRVGTSYLGVSNAPITNKYISRAILL